MKKHEALGKTVRRILQVGNSSGVTLPDEYLRAHGLKRGDLVEVTFNRKVLIEPLNLEELRRKVG
jgi:antitoxin component of MazEF toxin-antitoxin module